MAPVNNVGLDRLQAAYGALVSLAGASGGQEAARIDFYAFKSEQPLARDIRAVAPVRALGFTPSTSLDAMNVANYLKSIA